MNTEQALGTLKRNREMLFALDHAASILMIDGEFDRAQMLYNKKHEGKKKAEALPGDPGGSAANTLQEGKE